MGDEPFSIAWNSAQNKGTFPYMFGFGTSSEVSDTGAVSGDKNKTVSQTDTTAVTIPLVSTNDAPVDSFTRLPDRTNLPRPAESSGAASSTTSETTNINRKQNFQLFTKRRTKGHDIAQQNMEEFLNALNENKESLMEDLGLSDEEYERLVNIALGIAEQETHFGDKTYIDHSGEETWQKRLIVKDMISKLPINTSKGLTQIIYDTNFTEGSQNKAIAEKYGIFSDKDYAFNPGKCAIATMIILKGHLRTAQRDYWQKRLAENNERIENNPNIEASEKENLKIKTDDIIAILWNGGGAIANRFKDDNDTVTIKDTNTESNFLIQLHMRSKDGMSYARYVRYYRTNYFGGKIQ